MAKFNWLHLSDWHQGKGDPNRDLVLDALVHDIERRHNISNGLKSLDFVVFSGDLAFSGKRTEFVQARKFLDSVLEAAGLSLSELVIVPGNHDVDRSEVRFLDKTETLRLSESDVSSITSNCNSTVFGPLRAYQNWLAEAKIASDDSPAYFEKDGQKVGVIKLNSSLLSGHNSDSLRVVDDYGHLIVGEHRAKDLIKTAKKGGSTILVAVVHHPLSWLTMREGLFERSRLNRLLRRECHFVLHGHEHEPDVVTQTSPQGQCVFIPAGAAYDRRDFANGYNYCSVDLDTWRFQVFLRRFNQIDAWLEDTATTGDGVAGTWGAQLPKYQGPPIQPPEQPAQTEVPVRITSTVLDSPLEKPAAFLARPDGSVALWVEIDDPGTGIREMGNNRHVLSHGSGPPYSNVFSLSCGPDDFGKKPENRVLAWKVWLANSGQRQATWLVNDSFAPGWHHFGLTWSRPAARLLLYIDGVETELTTLTGEPLSASNCFQFWPNVIQETITVGTWTDRSPVHFIETRVWGYTDGDVFLDSEAVAQLMNTTGPPS